MTANENSGGKGADGFLGPDLRMVLALLREKGWIIILCGLTAGAAAAAYIVRSPRMYVSRAVVAVEEGGKLLKIGGDAPEDATTTDETLKTVEQSLSSPELLLGLIERDRLREDPAFIVDVRKPASNDDVVKALSKHLSIGIRRDTRLIDVAYQARSPVLAQKVVEFLIAEFNRTEFERHAAAAETAAQTLQQQAGKLKVKLARSDAAVEAYREQNASILQGEGQSIAGEKLARLSQMVTDAKANRLKLEADYDQIKALAGGSPSSLLAIPSISNSAGIADLEKSIADKEAQMAMFKKLYGEKHPLFLAVSGELQELKAGLDQAIRKAADAVTSQYDSAARAEKKLQEAFHEQEEDVLWFTSGVLREVIDIAVEG